MKIAIVAWSGLMAIMLLSPFPHAASGYTSVLNKNIVPPGEFGNILINRIAEKNGVKPAAFSHWSHRQRHTCRVCHFELEFNMLVNATEITEAANKAGKYCGASGCHDGKAAFGHEEPHCAKCHTGNKASGSEKISGLSSLPKAKIGNGIDWVKALEKNMIKPVTYRTIKPSEAVILKPFLLAAQWNSIPPAVFLHKAHTDWLDCNNCHPDIFDLKKHTVKTYTMVGMIMKREFCGVCHMTVAFPMNDCQRCHERERGKEQ